MPALSSGILPWYHLHRGIALLYGIPAPLSLYGARHRLLWTGPNSPEWSSASSICGYGCGYCITDEVAQRRPNAV